MRGQTTTMTRVKLNVGGQLFVTSRDTLVARDTFFRALVEHNTNDEIFIDRDPTHFRHILNFLRNSPSFPSNASDIQQVEAEAEFYCISELVTRARMEKSNAQRGSVGHQLSIISSRLSS